MRFGLIAMVCALAAGCGCNRGTGARAVGTPERQVLSVDDVVGLSGLSLGEGGTILLVPERQRVLLVRAPDGAIARYPIAGANRGCDLESVAYLGGDRVALGIEQNLPGDGAAADGRAVVALARMADGEVTVTENLEIDTSMWGVSVVDNEGVEGLCFAGGFLVAGIETVGSGASGRFAPVGVYELATRTWTPYRLPLSSETGALSALTCRVRDGRLELFVVERHFGVLRILRTRVPAAAGELVPELVANLDEFADETGLNIEGIAVNAAGDLIMVNDNHYKTTTGDSELLLLRGVAP